MTNKNTFPSPRTVPYMQLTPEKGTPHLFIGAQKGEFSAFSCLPTYIHLATWWGF